jgi:hypothetical protein
MEVEKREEKMGGLGNTSSRVASAINFSSEHYATKRAPSRKLRMHAVTSSQGPAEIADALTRRSLATVTMTRWNL